MKRSVLVVVALLAVAVTAAACEGVKLRMTFKEGNDLYKAQKYDEAIAKYKEILAFDPDNYMANYLVAMSNLAMYHPGSTHPKDQEYAAESVKYLEKVMTLPSPGEEEHEKIVKYYLSILSSAGMEDKAVEYIEGQLRTDPRNIGLVQQLADLYTKKNDFQNALKYFRMRAELEPENKEAWYTVGVAIWARSYHGKLMVSNEERQELLPQGIEALDKALSLDPEYFEALTYLNLLYREEQKMYQAEGKLEEANEAFQKAETFMKKAIEIRDKRKAEADASKPAGA